MVNNGEDPEMREEGDEPASKKKKSQLFTSVPMNYNYQQHIVSGNVYKAFIDFSLSIKSSCNKHWLQKC